MPDLLLKITHNLIDKCLKVTKIWQESWYVQERSCQILVKYLHDFVRSCKILFKSVKIVLARSCKILIKWQPMHNGGDRPPFQANDTHRFFY